MAGRRVVAVAVLLLLVCGFSILSRLLAAPRPAPAQTALQRGMLAKPPLYPPAAPLLDLPDFRFLLNADPCGDGDVTGVLIVTSHVEHVELRSAHRRAYPRAELLRLGLRRVFLLAHPGPGREGAGWSRRALRDEGRRFQDLVQGSFDEAYRNLTYKHTMGLRWAVEYCPQARFVIKMDDDIVVDLYQLTGYMDGSDLLRSGSLHGYVLRGLHPSREPANKWFVTLDEYPGGEYPDFLSGWLYVTTPGVARLLVDGAQAGVSGRRYFWIDDLHLTGLVRDALPPPRPELRNMSGLFTVHPEVLHCCIAEPNLRCDILVGPNGGDDDLILRFQAQAARCHYGQSCKDRPPHRRIEKVCVVRAGLEDDRLSGVVTGQGEARQVRMF